jgi:hypothetical protein
MGDGGRTAVALFAGTGLAPDNYTKTHIKLKLASRMAREDAEKVPERTPPMELREALSHMSPGGRDAGRVPERLLPLTSSCLEQQHIGVGWVGGGGGLTEGGRRHCSPV